jgi:hypothetical protein
MDMTRQEYRPAPGQRTIIKCENRPQTFRIVLIGGALIEGTIFSNAPLVIKHGDGRAIVDFKLEAPPLSWEGVAPCAVTTWE